jgi:hypothetical protein
MAEGKSKARSPQYPIIGLGEAIAKAKAIYAKDYQNRIAKAVVAQHVGFKKLHGKSLGVIAALTRYGLLEGRGDDCRVSDRALAIIAHQPGSVERTEAVEAAANAPAIFQELDVKFPNGRGSDEALRAYLLTNKFIPDAADTVIHSYRETKKVVEAEVGGYDSADFVGESESETDAEDEPKPNQARHAVRQVLRIAGGKAQWMPAAGQERELTSGLLSKGTNFRLIVSGPIGVKEIETLIKKLEIDKELLADESEEGDDRVRGDRLT